MHIFAQIVLVFHGKNILILLESHASHQAAIPQNLPIPNRVTVPPHHIIRVSLDGVDPAIFHPFHNAHMVGDEGIAAVPLEENEHPWFRCGAAGQPSAPGLEPVHPGAHPRELGESAAVQQPTLFSAPGHENGAPLHTAGEPVPRPIGRAAHVAHLRLSNGHQVPVAAAQGDAVHDIVKIS